VDLHPFKRQVLDLIGDAARVVDETTGFRYFDARDLLGFVDGTANPTGAELPDATLIAADADPTSPAAATSSSEVSARHGRLGRALDGGAARRSSAGPRSTTSRSTTRRRPSPTCDSTFQRR
jgi:hypothetical protein